MCRRVSRGGPVVKRTNGTTLAILGFQYLPYILGGRNHFLFSRQASSQVATGGMSHVSIVPIPCVVSDSLVARWSHECRPGRPDHRTNYPSWGLSRWDERDCCSR